MSFTRPVNTKLELFISGVHENHSSATITSIINRLNIGNVINVLNHTGSEDHPSGTYVFLNDINPEKAEVIEKMSNQSFSIEHLYGSWKCSINSLDSMTPSIVFDANDIYIPEVDEPEPMELQTDGEYDEINSSLASLFKGWKNFAVNSVTTRKTAVKAVSIKTANINSGNVMPLFSEKFLFIL